MGIIKKGVGKYRVDVVVRVKTLTGYQFLRKRKTLLGSTAQARIVEGELLKSLRAEPQGSLKFKTFGQCLEEYLKAKGGSWDSFRKNELREILGAVPLKEAAPRLARWLELKKSQPTRRGQPPASASINRFLQLAKAATNFCYIREYIDTDPLRRFKKDREAIRIRHIWPHEWEALFQHLPQWLKPICQFAYLIPTRKGELCKALRSDVDFVNSELRLRGETTKTGETRCVPIPASLLTYFGSIPKDCPWAFYRDLGKGRYKPLGDFHGSWNKAADKADVKNLRFHDLRGTAGTNMYAKGVELGVVCDIGGWKNANTFFKHYYHVFPEKRREAAQKVDWVEVRKAG